MSPAHTCVAQPLQGGGGQPVQAWQALQEVERIGLEAGGGSFKKAHRLLGGDGAAPLPSDAAAMERLALAHSELAQLASADAQPASLVPACTSALDAAGNTARSEKKSVRVH